MERCTGCCMMCFLLPAHALFNPPGNPPVAGFVPCDTEQRQDMLYEATTAWHRAVLACCCPST